MTETQLQRMMLESAEQIDVSSPPMAAIARSARRRRAGAVALAAAAAVLVAGAVVAVPGLTGSTSDVAPAGQAPGGTGHGSARRYSADEVPVFLPTSAFDVGTDHLEGRAVTTGVLVATHDDQCLVVGDDQTPVFWPAGYEGLTHDDHGFSLLDERGQVVAEVGDTVRLGGRWLEPADWGFEYDVCIPDDRKVFMVQARPDVVR